MDIRSDDTPAFLYAFANALAMRNVYIARAQITLEGGKLHDRFAVRNRYGQKFTDPVDQQQLRLTAVLIKQFTHALTWLRTPQKPGSVRPVSRPHRSRGERKGEGGGARLSRRQENVSSLRPAVGRQRFSVGGFSPGAHDHLLPLLQDYRDAPLIKPQTVLGKRSTASWNGHKDEAGRKEALNRFKDQELFRIDMKHIVEPDRAWPTFRSR